MSDRNYWTTLRQRKISRRTMLGASAKAGVGAAGLALVGCGDDDDAAPAAVDTSAIDAAAGDASAAASAAGEASAAASEASAAASEAAAAASQAADAADAAAALAAEAAESEDAANAAAGAEAAAAAAAQAADAASAAGDAAAAAVADAAAQAAEAAAQAARDAAAEAAAAAAAAAVEAGTATAAAAQAAINAAAEAAAETAAAAVAAAQEAADAAREAAESAAMAAEEDAPAQAVSGVARGGTVKSAGDELLGQYGMDPSTATVQSGLWRMIYDPLIATRPDGQVDLDASLAESFELVDDTTIVFTLRKGVKFHDGTGFDAEAVKYNLDRAVDTDIPGGGLYAAAFSVIESKEVLDSHTIGFNLTGPNAALLTNLQERGGMIASPTHVEATALEELRVSPVGTGPYQLSSWVSEQSTVLTPFQDGWQRREDGGPYALLDEFHYVVIPDEVVRAASLEAGDIDTMVAPDSQVGLLLENEDLTSVVRKGALHFSWGVNHVLYPADNVDFRRALMHAWDKEGMNEVFFGGRADLGDSILTSGSWAHVSQENYPTEFNLEKARELLVQSGIPEDDRVIEIGTGWAPDTPKVEALAANWEQLGVRVIRATVDEVNARLYKNRGNAGDLHWFGGGGDRGDPDTFLKLNLTEQATYNPGAAPVPEVEGLVQDAAATYDTEERLRIYAEIQEIHAERLYTNLPGLYSPRYQFSRSDVGGTDFDLNRTEWFKELHRTDL